ncbi:flagellar brake protein [Acetivibrio cellulolyticus]|uniref:flagellar brake protein n=1 Tax=Acetivibrio cellulolyticus TaxID=35830 RepID=UPI0001E2C238|nr:PilZ domain-containing protein [Acetivibrio cellulolyticus]
MKYSDLNLGLKLELQLLGYDGRRIDKPFVSEFEWAVGNDTVFIAAPIHEGRLYPVQIGTRVIISFIKENNLFEFEAIVIDRESKHNLALLKIQAIGQIEKVQRREFFRFDCCVPVNYREVQLPKQEFKEDIQFIKTVTRDISGGGLCMRLKEPVEQDKLIECELFITSKINFFGRVVRLTKYDTIQGIYRYEIGVVFEKIDAIVREKVVGYIFQEQRRLLKKG